MASHIQKYNLKDRGLKLESENPQKAVSYYCNLINHEYFANDYYPYRRLVLMYEKTGEYDKINYIIEKFFKSGIYCSEYNFLWFKYKLDLNEGEIHYYEELFKKNSAKNRDLADTPLPIADRLKRRKNKIIIETKAGYNRRQKIYAYELKASVLKREKKYSEYIDLLNYMIDEEGLKKADYLKKLCSAYHKVKDKDSELKVIERYFAGETRRSKANDIWFEKRLEKLNEKEIKITLEGEDLSRNPFYEYLKKLDLAENIKRKAVMIEYGRKLDLSDAISYYKYLSNNSYFSNDCYPYVKLTEIYDKIGNYNTGLVNIKKLLQSRIYLNEYYFLYFSDKLRQLMEICDADDESVERWLDDYQIGGAANRFRSNKYPADRFIIEGNTVRIISDDEYEYSQELLALKEKGLIYERVENWDLAITHYVKTINEGEFNCLHFHCRLSKCLEIIKDYKRMKKAAKLYFEKTPFDRTDESDEYFKHVISRLTVKS